MNFCLVACALTINCWIRRFQYFCVHTTRKTHDSTKTNHRMEDSQRKTKTSNVQRFILCFISISTSIYVVFFFENWKIPPNFPHCIWPLGTHTATYTLPPSHVLRPLSLIAHRNETKNYKFPKQKNSLHPFLVTPLPMNRLYTCRPCVMHSTPTLISTPTAPFAWASATCNWKSNGNHWNNQGFLIVKWKQIFSNFIVQFYCSRSIWLGWW